MRGAHHPQPLSASPASVDEAQARGMVAAVYADIRATLGVSMVNLVWRHLATEPALLAWAWTSVRPLYADGHLERAAATLGASLRLPPVRPLATAALATAGVDRHAQATIAALLSAYERANGCNLLALETLRRGHRHAPGAGAPLPGVAPAHAGQLQVAPIPALVVREMPAALATMVHRLNGFGAAGEPRLCATVYRQLAHWPGLIALLVATLDPLATAGALQRLSAGTAAAAQRLAEPLRPRLAALGAPPQPALFESACALFIDDGLRRMIGMVAILRRLLPAARIPAR